MNTLNVYKKQLNIMDNYSLRVKRCLKTLVILLMVASVILGCKQKSKKTDGNKSSVINIENILNSKKEVKLSEIAEDIEYIKLESTKGSLFKERGTTIHMTAEYIFVDSYGGVLQFARDGKFIRKIGNQGKGPREYVYVSAISFNEQLGHLYIYAPSKILIYSFNGEFIKEIKVHDIYSQVIGLNDGLFVAWTYVSYGYEKNIFLLLNSNMDTLSSVKNYFKWQQNGVGYRIGYSDYHEFHQSGDRMFFKDMYTDTVYTVSDELKIVPSYYVNLGKYKIPESRRLYVGLKAKMKLLKEYLWANVQESDKYVFINAESYVNSGGKYLLLYNKENSSGFVVSDSPNKFSGFTNDIDGGLDFWPGAIYADQYMYLTIQAYEFIEATTEALKHNKKDIINPEKQKQLKNFVNGLSDEDNPVVMVVTLKR